MALKRFLSEERALVPALHRADGQEHASPIEGLYSATQASLLQVPWLEYKINIVG
jgi:hypothetical protein